MSRKSTLGMPMGFLSQLSNVVSQVATKPVTAAPTPPQPKLEKPVAVRKREALVIYRESSNPGHGRLVAREGEGKLSNYIIFNSTPSTEDRNQRDYGSLFVNNGLVLFLMSVFQANKFFIAECEYEEIRRPVTYKNNKGETVHGTDVERTLIRVHNPMDGFTYSTDNGNLVRTETVAYNSGQYLNELVQVYRPIPQSEIDAG